MEEQNAIKSFSNEYATLKYLTNDKRSLTSQIIIGLMNQNDINADVIEILSFKSHKKGSGKELLKSFCDEHSDCVIILQAEPMYDTFEEHKHAWASGEFDKSLSKLVEYYSQNDFTNINAYIDNEMSVAFILNNEKGKKIIEEIFYLIAEY